MTQRTWHEVVEGEKLPPLAFPLTIYRLVMVAGANRDFNAIHHNSEYARASGAPDMYANTLFLQGMWERSVRDYIGAAGTIRRLSGFRMRRFNPASSTPTVTGRVGRKWIDDEIGLVEIMLETRIGDDVTVGPGSIVATLPI
jgi:hypothetical protein